MTTQSDELTSINVVPRFSRCTSGSLWKKGYFQDERPRARTCSPTLCIRSPAPGATSMANALQDLPFVQGRRVTNSACEWGHRVFPAGSGLGRVVPDLYTWGATRSS